MTPAPISVERLRELLAVSSLRLPLSQFGAHVDGADGDTVADCYYNAAHEQDGRDVAELFAAAVNALPALLHQLAERDAEVERLKVQLSESRREMELIWDEVQRVSPWSPSNDMLWSDEVATGIHFLAQRAETAGRLLRDCLDREYNPFERDNQSGHYNRIAAFLAASGGA